MQITLISKVQGDTDFSSEGVGVTLEPVDVGFPDPKTPEEAEAVFAVLNDFANHLVATAMYKYGRIDRETAVVRRSLWKKHIGNVGSEMQGKGEVE